MFLLITTTLAAPSTVITVQWNKGVRRLRATAPTGQEIAPDAPVDLNIRAGERSLSTSGNGAWLTDGIDLGGLHGPIEGQLDLQLCDKSSGVCKPASYAVSGLLPDSKKGTIELEIATAIKEGAHEVLFNHDVNPAVEAAYTRAKQRGDRVLLDFSAIWCPPCNALAAEVLHAPDAETLLEGFQVVVVDVDHPSSWPLKSQYDVGGYPTVVITDIDGKELERVEGYPGKQAFLDTLANIGEASPFAAKSKAFHENPSIEGFEDLVAYRPEMVVEILMENEEWALSDHGKDTVRTMLPELITRVSPAVGADILWFHAKFLPESERRLTYAAAAALLKASFRGVPADRAYYGFLAHLLTDADDLNGAIAFLDQQARETPDDPTFLLDSALLLNKSEQYKEALRHADRAAPLSWGDIALRVEAAACEALVGLGRADEAKARAQTALDAQPAPAEELKVRTHRYRAKLTKFIEP